MHGFGDSGRLSRKSTRERGTLDPMSKALIVMFFCSRRHVAARAAEPSMTRERFNLWLVDFRTPRLVSCPECWKTHALVAQDYFLEGDRLVA
jgi:hypothetical protein